MGTFQLLNPGCFILINLTSPLSPKMINIDASLLSKLSKSILS